jgi:hypothetical protein
MNLLHVVINCVLDVLEKEYSIIIIIICGVGLSP